MYVCYYQLLPNLTNSTLIHPNVVNKVFFPIYKRKYMHICQSYVPINNVVFPAHDVGDDDDILYIAAIIV